MGRIIGSYEMEDGKILDLDTETLPLFELTSEDIEARCLANSPAYKDDYRGASKIQYEFKVQGENEEAVMQAKLENEGMVDIFSPPTLLPDKELSDAMFDQICVKNKFISGNPYLIEKMAEAKKGLIRECWLQAVVFKDVSYYGLGTVICVQDENKYCVSVFNEIQFVDLNADALKEKDTGRVFLSFGVRLDKVVNPVNLSNLEGEVVIVFYDKLNEECWITIDNIGRFSMENEGNMPAYTLLGHVWKGIPGATPIPLELRKTLEDFETEEDYVSWVTENCIDTVTKDTHDEDLLFL